MRTIRQLAADLEAGRTSSSALIEQAISRIDEHRRAGGTAYINVDADRARKAAAASDAARAAGHVPSLLAGLPVAIKDLFDVEGEVTTAGSTVLANGPPAASDAAVIARLRTAGAILLGRSNMVEFAFSGLGLNPHYGTPVNPFDERRIAGGSTSGGAVSVATGMAAWALGSDTGGSVRIPAAFCRLTGFKPTARRVDLTGVLPLSQTLDSCGPLAGSVDCCAIADRVLSSELLNTDAAPIRGLRLGISTDYVGEGLDDEVRNVWDASLAALHEAGASIEAFPFPELLELPAINRAGGISAAESWALHRARLEVSGTQYDPRVRARILRGSSQTAADYIDLLNARRRLIESARRRLSAFDAWVMPTIPFVPPLLAPLADNDEAYFAANAAVLRNPSIINFLDGCALTLPVGSGLPVGLSICGQHGQDARVLQVSRAIESVLRQDVQMVPKISSKSR